MAKRKILKRALNPQQVDILIDRYERSTRVAIDDVKRAATRLKRYQTKLRYYYNRRKEIAEAKAKADRDALAKLSRPRRRAVTTQEAT